MTRTFPILLASVVVTTCVLVMAVPANAAGLGFLRESPIYYFTDADRKLMDAAVLAVLNDEDGEAVQQWQNPKTGYSGKVQGTGKFRSSDGLDCRRLKLWTQAKGIESEALYPVCRDAAEGAWRLASGKELVRL